MRTARVARIAMISEHASPLRPQGSVDSGGQNVYVGQVAKHLGLLGYEVDVFTRRDSEDFPDIVEWSKGVRIIHVPAGPATFVRKEDLLQHMDEFTLFLRRFFCLRKRKPYQLIHANFWMSGLVAADLKRRLGIPFVITFHALGRVRRIFQGEADQFSDRRFEIEDRVVAEADRVLAECPQDQDDLHQLYRCDAGRIEIIPCGFDPQELWPIRKEWARAELGLDPLRPWVLHVGRLVPRKGVDTAIQGFARLVRAHEIDARMMIVGGDAEDPRRDRSGEMSRLREIARAEGVRDKVLFAGRKSRNVLKYYYSAADAFITTPWYEPFGITPVESMACGTPVIGAAVGGIRFTVRDSETGYLVPPKDPEAIGERLAHLLDRPKLIRSLGRRAILRANTYFSWGKVTADIARLYQEVDGSMAASPKAQEAKEAA